MPRHRNLTLDKLITLVQWEDVQRYLARLAPNADENHWAFINPDALQTFMETPENSDAAGVIMEHLHRVNDICWRDGALLVQVARQYRLDYNQDLPDLTFALRLYLDHPHAFDFAWSMYLRVALNAGPCEYRFPAGMLEPSRADVDLLESNLRGWFASMKKGNQCLVACFPEGDGLLLRVTRGARVKTIARWRGMITEIDSFRPANEDIIWYEPDVSRLSVKASLRRDREQYVRAVAEIFAKQPELAERAIKQPVYSLAPFQTGEFDYQGDGVLSNLRLVEVDLTLRGLTVPSFTLRSSNVLVSLEDQLPGVTLESGDLTRVKLRADIQTEAERRPREIVFTIEPPGFSDVGEKAYRGALEQYLRRQRVKLN